MPNEQFVVQIVGNDGDEPDDLMTLAAQLRSHIRELDVVDVNRAPSRDALPENAKGTAVDLVNWLAVNVGPESVTVVLTALASWAVRTQRKVVVHDSRGSQLTLSNATKEQQARIIDDWIASHATDS